MKKNNHVGRSTSGDDDDDEARDEVSPKLPGLRGFGPRCGMRSPHHRLAPSDEAAYDGKGSSTSPIPVGRRRSLTQ